MGHAVDVAIIGGGVTGCAAAYYLTREGLDVAVIDHQGIANAASGYALGLLNPLSGAAYSRADWRRSQSRRSRSIAGCGLRLEEESSIDFQGRMMPHLEDRALDETDKPLLCLNEMERWNATDGFSARWLDCEEVRASRWSNCRRRCGGRPAGEARHGGQSTADEGTDGCRWSKRRSYCS